MILPLLSNQNYQNLFRHWDEPSKTLQLFPTGTFCLNFSRGYWSQSGLFKCTTFKRVRLHDLRVSDICFVRLTEGERKVFSNVLCDECIENFECSVTDFVYEG